MSTRILNGSAVLYNYVGESNGVAVYKISFIRNCLVTDDAGLSGDEMPEKLSVLYWFDIASSCSDENGEAIICVTPEEFAAMDDKNGYFTFDASGRDYIMPGGSEPAPESPDENALRIVSVERFRRGRRFMHHYKIEGR